MRTPRQTVEKLYEAHKAGDLETLMSLMDPDLECTFEGDPQRVLFAGSYRGPNGFLRFIGRVGATIDTRKLDIVDVREQGEEVLVHARETMRSRNTGREATFDMQQRFLVREGRIAEFHESTDAEALAKLLGEGGVSGLPEQCIENEQVRVFDQVPGIRHRTLAGNGPHPGATKGLEVWHQLIEPGAATPPHRHDCEEVVVLLKGRMLCIVEGVKQEVGPHSTIIVPQNAWHVLEPLGDEPCELIGVLNMAPVEVFLPGDRPMSLPWDAIPAAEAAVA